MLQKIQKRIRGWVAGFITAILALTFVMWGVQSYEQSGSGQNKVVAKVGDSKVTSSEVDAIFQQWRTSQERRLNRPLTIPEQQQIRSMALQQIVNARLLYLAALKDGFYVSIDQIKQMIMSEPEFQEHNQFSDNRFRQILIANGLTPQSFFLEMQQGVTTRQITDGLLLSSFVLRGEMSNIYSLVKQKRSFGYGILPTQNFLSQNAISDQQINDYYQKNKEEFRDKERVKVSYLLLTPDEVSDSMTVSPLQVKEYYQEHSDDYSTAEQWQIDTLVIKVPENASKNSIAQAQTALLKARQQLLNNSKMNIEQISKQIPQSQILLGQWINADQMSDSMRTTMLKLKPNEVSLPFNTKAGLAIVQLKAIKPSKQKDFAEVQSSVIDALKHKKVQQILNQKSEKLSELTYTNPNTLSVASDSLHLPIKISDWITKEGEQQGIFSDQKVLDTVFSSDILQQGNNSEPIELSDGSIVVIRVHEHRPSLVKPLAEVKDEISQILKQKNAQKQAGLVAFEIQKALENGVSPQTLATKYHFNWLVKQNISRDDKTLLKPIRTAVFNLIPSNNSHPVTTTLLDNGNYVIMQLNNIELSDYNKATPEEVTQLKNSLLNYLGQTTYQLYSQSATSKVKVHYTQPQTIPAS